MADTNFAPSHICSRHGHVGTLLLLRLAWEEFDAVSPPVPSLRLTRNLEGRPRCIRVHTIASDCCWNVRARKDH